jgi:hypothetical protein
MIWDVASAKKEKCLLLKMRGAENMHYLRVSVNNRKKIIFKQTFCVCRPIKLNSRYFAETYFPAVQTICI